MAGDVGRGDDVGKESEGSECEERKERSHVDKDKGMKEGI